MSILSGDRYTVLEWATLAITTEDSYYFPPGIKIAGTNDVDGIHTRILLKEFGFAGSDASYELFLEGVRINYRDGSQEDLYGDAGGHAVQFARSFEDEKRYQLMLDINDISNIEMVIENIGAGAKKLYAWIRYEPLKPGDPVTVCH